MYQTILGTNAGLLNTFSFIPNSMFTKVFLKLEKKNKSTSTLRQMRVYRINPIWKKSLCKSANEGEFTQQLIPWIELVYFILSFWAFVFLLLFVTHGKHDICLKGHVISFVMALWDLYRQIHAT